MARCGRGPRERASGVGLVLLTTVKLTVPNVQFVGLRRFLQTGVMPWYEKRKDIGRGPAPARRSRRANNLTATSSPRAYFWSWSDGSDQCGVVQGPGKSGGGTAQIG
jgi:hypothetical protein